MSSQASARTYVSFPESKSDNAALSAFRAWVEGQASQYREAAGLG